MEKEMERLAVRLENWRIAIVPHSAHFSAKTIVELEQSGHTMIPAQVPGNFELDMMRAGLLEDLYYGDNVLAAQKLEDRHVWYVTTFDLACPQGRDAVLTFHGIDTVAEIFVDGELLGTAENMFIPHTYSLSRIPDGCHELVVHILPASVAAGRHRIPLGCVCQRESSDTQLLRKAPYMYGWDIMPRIVSAGLWKPVEVEYLPKTRIREVYLCTTGLQKDSAELRLAISTETNEALPTDLTWTVEGRCGEHVFRAGDRFFGVMSAKKFIVENPQLWMPVGYGASNLYEVTVSLFCRAQLCDRHIFRFGIRTVQLERTSLSGNDGEFCFRVNGQKIFAMGTNWVPTDAFPSRHEEYQLRGLEMLTDLGCNIVRCWGGNVYPNDDFYDYCDEHGILVWQDFAMACGNYPNNREWMEAVEEEAISVITALRNHPSLLLWSGDNECDAFTVGRAVTLDGTIIQQPDPNDNLLTRRLLPRLVAENDFARPFLPSSPYMDADALRYGHPAEDHLWGPRDYFKGDYYANAECHFASETGYHGCPAPASLIKFIGGDHLHRWGDSKCCEDSHWLSHSTCMEMNPSHPYAYRIPLMTSQVERLFGQASDRLTEYALQSQISQAEAKKYFVERFRIGKWRRTGIIWWNLVDGWPQISDSVVDWYGCKKLAYSYIKRSQQLFCMMVDEPKDGMLTLCAANDTDAEAEITYTVENLHTHQIVLAGNCRVHGHETTRIASFVEEAGGFYLIRWQGDQCGTNHFTAAIGDGIRLDRYTTYMKEADFWKDLQGFD